MSNVVLSLDGRKEINDLKRVDYAGNGSYDKIVPKFKQLVESRGGQGYYMRGTFTHANPDFTKDVFHMADLGFTDLSMEPVVSSPEDPAALTPEDLEIVKEHYEILAKEMIQRKKEAAMQIQINEMKERLETLETSSTEKRNDREAVLQAANTIYLYAALSEEEARSQSLKEKQAEIRQASEAIIQTMQT